MFKKALLFELRRIFFNRKNIIYSILIVLLFALFCFGYKSQISLQKDDIDYEKEIEFYTNSRDSAKLFYEIAEGIVEKPPYYMLPHNYNELKESYRKKYLLYNYYLETNTFDSDYVRLDNPLYSHMGLEGGVFIILMAKALPIILFVISFFLSNFYIFEDANTKNKLFLQGKVPLKKIYYAKMILSFLFVVFIALIYSVIVILIGGKENYYILVVNKDVTRMNIKVFLLIKVLISLSYSIMIISLFSTIYYFVKNKLYNVIISCSILGFSYLIMFFVKFIIGSSVIESIEVYFPFVNSHISDYSLNDIRLWIIMLINAIITIVMILIYNRKCNWQNN